MSIGRVTGRTSGFTLFEMIIVLTVLTVVVGLAWPAVAVIQGEYQLRQGGQTVQARLAAARMHAVDSGHPYQFCYEPGGYRFLFLPLDAQALQTQAGTGTKAPYKAAGKLPSEKTHFEAGAGNTGPAPLVTAAGTSHAIPAEWLNGLPNAAEFTGVNWSAPIVFHPDGTAMGAPFQVVDKKGRHVSVTIRSLTGAVTVSGIQNGGKR